MKKLMTIDELSELIGMKVGAIRQAIHHRRGSVPPGVKVGNRWRWNPDDVERWIKERTVSFER